MKLLCCPKCRDVVKLQCEERHCKCGHVHGRYEEDGLHATVSKGAAVLGIDNFSLWLAMTRVDGGIFDGGDFKAFVIPRISDRVRWGDD